MNNIVISESTPVGTEIYKLEGIDPEGSTLRYDIFGTDVLSVDHDTGVVTIVKPLDYEVKLRNFIKILSCKSRVSENIAYPCFSKNVLYK